MEDDDHVDDAGIVLFSSHSISPQYAVGTSQLTIFEGVLSKLPYGYHYVYWRDGQYNYRFAYSRDLSLSGTVFSASQVTIVTYYTYSSSGTQATYTSVSETSFSLSAGSYMVWSDLGDYPTLQSYRGAVDYAHLSVVILATIILLYIFDNLRRGFRL